MLMLGLSERIDKLAMAINVRWYGIVSRGGGQSLKEERVAKEDMEEVGGGTKCGGRYEKGRCTLPIKVDCWC